MIIITKKSSRITSADAGRIQAHADRNGTNQGFKARAQKAAEKNNKK
ncbi:hypothetical protein [Methanoplanus limicola]|nr:hypothetical protein [Methanoplanus limicola]